LIATTGGWLGLAAILVVQSIIAVVFALTPQAAIVMVFGTVAVVIVLVRPVLGVGILIAARLLSTGATTFFRVGPVGISLVEPVVVVCACALALRVATHRRIIWSERHWLGPYLCLLAWVCISMMWSVDPVGGLTEVLPMLLVLVTASVIVGLIDNWNDFRLMLWVWVSSCVAIGVISAVLTHFGIDFGGFTFEAATGGGRETGLGQQPNWYAMNLMFIIHTCFGMALIETRPGRRRGLFCAGTFVFFMMLTSGSRGGAYATIVGAVLMALSHRVFRQWFIRFLFVTMAIFVMGIVFDVGGSQRALSRIASDVSLHSNIRPLNWSACVSMLIDTHGLGIGVGGYNVVLPRYNAHIAQTVYDYPHGILWEVMAHYGVIGMVLLGLLVRTIFKMTMSVIDLAKGTAAEVIAWTMPASMLGYAAWSFFEFTVNEKPFWEFLSLYTALYFVLRKSKDTDEDLPVFSTPLVWLNQPLKRD